MVGSARLPSWLQSASSAAAAAAATTAAAAAGVHGVLPRLVGGM